MYRYVFSIFPLGKFSTDIGSLAPSHRYDSFWSSRVVPIASRRPCLKFSCGSIVEHALSNSMSVADKAIVLKCMISSLIFSICLTGPRISGENRCIRMLCVP